VVGDCVTDTLILVHLNLSKIFESLSSDVKGLSKKGGSMEHFEPLDLPLYFISIIIGVSLTSHPHKFCVVD